MKERRHLFGHETRCPRGRLLRGARPGFTLVELMIVTAILSILAMIAVPQITKARQRAMMTAARMDMREALRAIEMYRILNHGALPQNLQQMESVEYHESDQNVVCRFEVVTGGGEPERVAIDIRHSRANRGVRSEYPTWEGRIDEVDLGSCSSVRAGA